MDSTEALRVVRLAGYRIGWKGGLAALDPGHSQGFFCVLARRLTDDISDAT